MQKMCPHDRTWVGTLCENHYVIVE